VSSPSRKPALSSAHYAANSTTSEVHPKAAFVRTMADEAEALEKGLEQAAQPPPPPVDSWEWSSIATADMVCESSDDDLCH
jgi:hypothetical protein